MTDTVFANSPFIDQSARSQQAGLHPSPLCTHQPYKCHAEGKGIRIEKHIEPEHCLSPFLPEMTDTLHSFSLAGML